MDYRSVVAALGDGIVVVNETMAITFMNDTAKGILDLENINTTDYSLEEALDVQTNEEQEFIRSLVEDVLESGEACGLKNNSYLIGKNGAYKYLSASITRCEIEGQYSAVITLRDITRFKAFEFDYLNEKRKLESLFNVLPVGIIFMTLERKVEYVNPTITKLFGLEDKPIKDLLFGNLVKCHNCIDNLCGDAPMCESCEIRHNMDLLEIGETFKETLKVMMEHKDGSILYKRHYNIDFIPIEDNDKEKVMLVISDITKQIQYEEGIKRAKEEAEAALKLKSQFLSNMSHEIRTPLNGIIGMLNLTRRRLNDKELIENLDIAKTSSESLLGIINDVLDYSKLEANRLQIYKKPMNIHHLLQEVYNENRYHASLKHLTFDLQMDNENPSLVYGDKLRIKQVLTNLVGNAIKFTDSGSVSIHTHIGEKGSNSLILRVTVTDTGIGIKEEDKERIFHSFIQADGSFTRKKGGTGLGLAISKEITKLMGGHIYFESEENKGTAFTFSIVLDKALESAIHKQPETISESGIYGNILLAEDDLVNQMVLSKKLEMAGHHVTCVKNGREAVDVYLDSVYDLMILDIQMPVMSGLEAIEAIVKSKKGKTIPIVALTAYALTQERKVIMKHGFDMFITKPVDLDQFEKKINGLIVRSRLIDEAEDDDEPFELSIPKDDPEYVEDQLEQIQSAIDNNNFEAVNEGAEALKTYFELKEMNELRSAAFKLAINARKEKTDEITQLYQKIIRMLSKETGGLS